jgi:amino acid transporter
MVLKNYSLLGSRSRRSDLVPVLAGHSRAPSVVLVVVRGLLQWRGTRSGSIFQDITSAAGACVFIVLIAAAIMHPHARASLTASSTMPAGIALFGAWVLVLQSVLGTYDGWYGALSTT